MFAEQIQLVEPPRPFSALRPTFRESAVLDRAMPEVHALFEKYLNGFYVDEGPPEEIRELLKVENDGYEMARRLEREHQWEPDRDLVDVCDRAIGSVDDAYRKLVEEWIAAFRIQPKLLIDSEVSFKVHFGNGAGTYQGIITKSDGKRGQYTIMIPALGYVREGLGTHGFVANWEDVERGN